MTAQKGRDLLLKIDDGAAAFVTVAGLRARQLSLNAETIDATDSESAGRWRELLAGAGLRRASISGSGIFKDAASDELVRAAFFASDNRSWQIIVPDFGMLSGPFQIVSLEYSGQHTGEVAFEIVLESAGEILFSAI
ncbi:MAG: phage major tail protein, TP901-1 family [Nitratireductor sp.]|nr:phage major tail protein, TP901-1 family [Nitratireductor sp.]